MPQTSDAIRLIISKWFPNEYGVDDAAREDRVYQVRQVLLSKGWTEERGCFHPPTPSHYGPREEYILLRYLVEEWDYDYKSAPLIEDLK